MKRELANQSGIVGQKNDPFCARFPISVVGVCLSGKVARVTHSWGLAMNRAARSVHSLRSCWRLTAACCQTTCWNPGSWLSPPWLVVVRANPAKHLRRFWRNVWARSALLGTDNLILQWVQPIYGDSGSS